MIATQKQVVYIVEDDATVASSVAALMMSLGIKTEVFNTAEAFVDSLHVVGSGCLILDVRLPGMSGLELQRLLAEREVEIPTIVISGHGDAQARELALKNGAVAFQEKPYSSQELCELVKAQLSQM